MSNKRPFSDSNFPLHNDTPRTPSKRASGDSRLQNPDLQSPGGANQGISRFNGFIFNKPDPQSPGGANQGVSKFGVLDFNKPDPQGVSKFGVLDFNKPDPQSPGGANQHTPRKITDVLLSLGRTHSPLKGSTYSWASRAFDAAQYADNPFLSHEQPSQPEQEKSSCEGNVLSPARLDSSSDDSDSSSDTSPDTSPTKPACTPKKSVAKPTHRLLSPMQFLSSPSQAVLETLIPLLDEQNEDSDDVGPQHFSRPQAIRLCQEVFNCTPKVEQLEVLSHIAQKIDCVLIAPCGWGKTLAFFLPMVLWPYRITAIISPLIALMNDQQQKLVKARIPHIVLSGDNSDAINGDLINRIIEGEFRAVFMSPEIIFGDSPTSKLVHGLWHNTHFQNQLLAIVVDEVHCVEKWGQKFRPEYDRLGELRIWSPGVPFVGVTATLTADALAQTMSKLFLSKANVIRVQEMPTNVRLEVHTQPKDAMMGLHRLLGEDKTIIYFEKISLLIDVHKYLKRTRPDLRNKLGLYYSTLTSDYKAATMTKFMEGDIHILLATEAAGMGCDIPDVVQVIQYGFPRDIPSLVQRCGRAARDPRIQGFGILYAPPITKTSPSDNNVRDYLTNHLSGKCLWSLIDKLFENKVRVCDNNCSGCSKIYRSAPTTICHNIRSSKRRRCPNRSEEEKHMALKKLLEWRRDTYETWVSNYPYRWGIEAWILPDNVATLLSQKFSGARTAEAVEDFASSCKWMPLTENNVFDEIAQVLDKLNNEIDAGRGLGSKMEDDSDGDREGSDGEEDLLVS